MHTHSAPQAYGVMGWGSAKVLSLGGTAVSKATPAHRGGTPAWASRARAQYKAASGATMRSTAHQLAARGAAGPTPWAVPLPHLLPAPLFLHYRGSLFVEPQLGLDAAYDATTTSAYFSGRRAHLLRPHRTIFQELLEADNIPTRAIKRALAYRVLEWQPPPEPHIPMECHFCGTTEHQLWRHVRSRCPAAFLHLRRAQALLLHATTPTPAATVTGDGHLLDGQGRPVLSYTWDSHFTSEAAGMGDVLSLSGLWYASPDGAAAFLTAATRRRIPKDVVSALAQPVLTPLTSWPCGLHYRILTARRTSPRRNLPRSPCWITRAACHGTTPWLQLTWCGVCCPGMCAMQHS